MAKQTAAKMNTGAKVINSPMPDGELVPLGTRNTVVAVALSLAEPTRGSLYIEKRSQIMKLSSANLRAQSGAKGGCSYAVIALTPLSGRNASGRRMRKVVENPSLHFILFNKASIIASSSPI